jgi:hypothetical protein
MAKPRTQTPPGSNRQDIHRILYGHRQRHGWQTGWVWSPDAWTKGQDCGCGDRHPCGWYTNPLLRAGPEAAPARPRGRLIQVTVGGVSFGLETRDGVVVDVAPVGSRWKILPGMPERPAAARLKAAGATFREVRGG